VSAVSPEDIAQAAARLRPLVRRTPVLFLRPGELGVDFAVTVKLEYLQHTGSFKARGAMNSVLTAPAGTSRVVAASGGNHGAAVAWAAHRAGLPATVFVPSFSPRAKQDLIRAFGAELRLVDGYYADALTASLELAATTGALHVDAYDTVATVAGQASLGVELAEQIPAGEPVVVACGGGGLFAGVTLALAGRNPVVAAEPHTAPTLLSALAAGGPVAVEVSGLARDSLGARRVGEIAYAVAREQHSRVLAVSDEQIEQAVALLWDRVRISAEPGGATGLAAVLAHPDEFGGDAVTVVVSGANSDARSTPPR
jgi:threonine dehydratase